MPHSIGSYTPDVKSKFSESKSFSAKNFGETDLGIASNKTIECLMGKSRVRGIKNLKV